MTGVKIYSRIWITQLSESHAQYATDFDCCYQLTLGQAHK